MREGNVSAKMHVGCSQTRNDQGWLGVFGSGVSSGKQNVWKKYYVFVSGIIISGRNLGDRFNFKIP